MTGTNEESARWLLEATSERLPSQVERIRSFPACQGLGRLVVDQNNQSRVIIEERSLKDGFTQIPNTILMRVDISPGAKLAYATLLMYGWNGTCFPGQQTLAQNMGVSTRSVINYLKELTKLGLVQIKRRGLTQSNEYHLKEWVHPRSENPSPQDVKEAEVKNLQPEEYPIPEDTQLEDNSKIRIAPPSKGNRAEYDEDRQVILEYIDDLAREFRDKASLKSSTTRAANLFRQSGLSLDEFLGRLQQARAITKERSASIRSQAEGSSSKHKMAYFFACLDDLLSKKPG